MLFEFGINRMERARNRFERFGSFHLHTIAVSSAGCAKDHNGPGIELLNDVVSFSCIR